MTSFIAWRAGDENRPGSLYFASDSRRSWKAGDTRDDCIKLYAPIKSPDIFGMLGEDITLPETVLPELCGAIDAGAIPPGQRTSAYGRNEWIACEFRKRLSNLRQHGSFSVFHGSRNGFGVNATFLVFHLRYCGQESNLYNTEETLPDGGSCAIVVEGSGADSVDTKVSFWTREIGDYSRSYFSGFCDALMAAEDPLSGGAPQLLALGNSGSALHLGVVTPSGSFYRGRIACALIPGIKWRNERFELVDQGGRLLEGAQLQPRPEPLKSP